MGQYLDLVPLRCSGHYTSIIKGWEVENKAEMSCWSGRRCVCSTTGHLCITFHELQFDELLSVAQSLSCMSGHTLSLFSSSGYRFTDGSVGSSCGCGLQFLLCISLLSCAQDRRGTYWSVLQVRQRGVAAFLSPASRSCYHLYMLFKRGTLFSCSF